MCMWLHKPSGFSIARTMKLYWTDDLHIHVHTGAGNVTEVNDSSTVIACFIDEGRSYNLNCVVKNEGIQTDTVWSVYNYKGIEGPQTITNDEVFQISGDQRPTSFDSAEFSYGNNLDIRNCSMKELDEVTVHCGSHVNPEQALFQFKVCGKLILDMVINSLTSFLHTELPYAMENKVILLEEGAKQCPVTVISSSLTIDHFIWDKNGQAVDDHLRKFISEDGFTIIFDKIEREDAGNYSVTISTTCHNSSYRSFNGNFMLDVICKFNL